MSGRRQIPIELRFIDLFLLIVAALMFVALVLIGRGSAGGPPPRILTRALPPAFAGGEYRVVLAAVQGSPPLKWRLVSQDSPGGMVLKSGALQAQALTLGTKKLVVEVRDADERTDSAELVLDILPASAPTTQAPPLRFADQVLKLQDGESGSAYRQRVPISGGSPPYRLRLSGGELPHGLELTPDGTIAGVPTVPAPSLREWLAREPAARELARRELGTRRFSLAITDAAGQAQDQTIELYVRPSPLPPVWQLLLDDLPPSAGPVLRSLAWLARALAFLMFVLLLVLGAFPWLMALAGYRAQVVPGWRGLFVHAPRFESRLLSPGLVPIAVGARKVVNLLSGLRSLAGSLFAAGADGTTASRPAPYQDVFDREDAPARENVPELGGPESGQPSWRDVMQAIRSARAEDSGQRRRRELLAKVRRTGHEGSEATNHTSDRWQGLRARLARQAQAVGTRSARRRARTGSANEQGPPASSGEERPNVEDYLEGLRAGGVVEHGGAFFALPLMASAEIEQRIRTPYAPLARLGNGLFHVASDHYLRTFLELKREAPAGQRKLDARFDVVLGRRAPTQSRPNEDARHQPEAGPQGPVLLPSFAGTAGAPDPALYVAVAESAASAHAWLLQRGTSGGAPVDAKLLRRLLRRPAHVRLEHDTLVVRFAEPRGARARGLLQALLRQLNALEPTMPGGYRFPVRLLAGPPPTEEGP